MFHDNLVDLKSRRNALKFILYLRKKVNCGLLPYYTDDVLLEFFVKLNMENEFLFFDSRLLPLVIRLNKFEFLIYINYFVNNQNNIRIKNDMDSKENLVTDNLQDFLDHAAEGLDKCYSARIFLCSKNF